MDSNQLLNVDGLTISFKNASNALTPAVKNISFSLQKGEIVGLVGESGSGKTVTGMSILDLLPSESVVQFAKALTYSDGSTRKEIPNLTEEELQGIRGHKIAMIFQEPMSAFNPVMRCGTQVAEVITTHTQLNTAQAKAKVLDLFQKVKLPDPERAYHAYPHQLSGGQLQRIMIAMAISCEPDLIIADEPTTALDVTVQNAILDLLKSLNKEYGMTILFVSHDLGVIASLCDRVLVMKSGELVESGTIEEIFHHPQHTYTKGLLACRPTVNTKGNRLQELYGEAPNPTIQTRKISSKNPVILEAKGLSKAYKSKTGWFSEPKITLAVNAVNLSIHQSEILGLVGESGCGKTTLSNILLGLQTADSGSVEYMGESIIEYTNKQWKSYRKDVQIIFQNPYASLNPKMRVGHIIQEPMEIHKLYSDKAARKAKTIELLQKVGLGEEHYDRYPAQFSGGQRQRIVIARALATNPKLIICDECVSALDVSIQASIINLLLDLRDELGLSYLFISHDLRVVKFVSDRIHVMHQGQIIETGTPDQIFGAPTQAYTKTLINSIPAEFV